MGARPEDFPVGAVVRLTASGLEAYRHASYRRGVVVGVVHRTWSMPHEFWVRVKVRRVKACVVKVYDPNFWEVVPHGALDADEAAVALANAVLAGDREAARALADRVMELCQEGGAG